MIASAWYARAGSLLRHRQLPRLLILATLIGLLQHMRHFERWAWQYESFVQETGPNRNDDADYAMLAEHFWGLQHDPGLSISSQAWQGALQVYPFRGIAHGTVQLLLRHFFHDQWRLAYVRFAAFLEFLGILSLAGGLAFYLRSAWLFPLVAHGFVRFSPFIDVIALRVTEGLLRGAIPLAAGLLFFASSCTLRGSRRRLRLPAWLACFVAVLFVTTLKVQWWLGFASFPALFLLAKTTRRLVMPTAGVAAGVYLCVLSINFFRFQGNTEFFASSGLMAARTVRGPELVELGCARNEFSREAAAFLCGVKYERSAEGMLRQLSWAALAEKLDDPQKFLELTSVLRRLNFEWVRSHPRENIERLWSYSAIIWSDAYADPRGIDPPGLLRLALFAVSVLLFLVLMPVEQSLALAGLFALSHLTVLLPNLSGPWEYRYLTPVRVYYHLIPVICAFGLFARFAPKLLLPRRSAKAGAQP